MEQRITLISLGVKDLVKSTEFYCDIFGWQLTGDSNENISFFQVHGMLLGLYPREELAKDAMLSPEGSGFNSFTLAHNLRSEDEVDQLFDELEAKGVTIIKKPEKVFWGGYSGYIADPDGHLWEIAYNPFMKFDKRGTIIYD